MGPGLGGGYGRYLGFYGLVADNFISLNVVLADGSAITVSETSYPDLWWAMRGAGHNFGIVTSLNQKIYKRTVDAWFYATYTFTQDKLENLFEAVNHMANNGTQPKELMHYMLYGWVPEISTTEVGRLPSNIANYQVNFSNPLACHRHHHLLRRNRRPSRSVPRSLQCPRPRLRPK